MSASAWRVTIVASFTLIIPIEWIIWLLALPSGLLIGYYANQRSNRVAGPWSRILVNGALRRSGDRADGRDPAPPHQGDLLLRRQRATPTSTGPTRTATDPALLPVGSGLHVPALPRRGTRPGPRRRRCHGRRVVHELLLGRAGRDGQHPRAGDDDRWPGRRRPVRRVPPEALGGGCRDEDRGRRRLVRLVRGARLERPGIETPRSNRGVVGAAGCRAIPWSWPSWPWAPPWRSPSVQPWGPRSRPSSERPSSRSPSSRSLAFVPVALVVEALAAGATTAVVADACAAALAAAASARAVLLRAARALPAAVWAPLALPALPAAMRALAALAAAALPVVFTTRPPDCTCSPPRAALILRVRRDLRRAAAFGWMAPTLAARSRALSASARAASGSIVDSVGCAARQQGLRDEGLRGGPARLEDLVAALGLTDPLES